MDIPPHKHGLIEELLAEYLQRPFTRSGDFREAARLHGAVPVFEGWTEVIFLRTNGSFFTLDTESGTGTISTEVDHIWQLASLTYATDLHPKFRQLLPDRPAKTLSCGLCNGHGWFTPANSVNAKAIVCGQCGGTGWL
jgi:hypothetical protein